MRRVIGCATALLACGVLTACETRSPAPPDQPSASTDSAPSDRPTVSPKPAPPDQSAVFFPAAVETNGLDHTPIDRDHLVELNALRQIDPCGLVDQETLAANRHDDFSYTYSPVHQMLSAGASPVEPLGGDGCTLAFPGTPSGLTLRIVPGERSWASSQFNPDPEHPGVAKQTSPACMYRVALPLTELAGAPESMRDPSVEVSPTTISDGRLNGVDASMCELAEAVVVGIAAHVQKHGIPVYSVDSSSAARFLTSDPCAAATNVDANGLIWHEPNPEAQWPTTWRHPGVCNLELQMTDGGPTTPSAVVRYGLAAWSDGVIQSATGGTPALSEKDGIALFNLSDDSAQSCFVVAKADGTVAPINIGAGAPDLVAPTPIVTVQFRTPDRSCADVAEETAVAALKRAM